MNRTFVRCPINISSLTDKNYVTAKISSKRYYLGGGWDRHFFVQMIKVCKKQKYFAYINEKLSLCYNASTYAISISTKI